MFGPLATAFSLSFTVVMSHLAIGSSLVDPSGETTRRFARFWGKSICRACGIRVALRGGESVDWGRPLIVMANHQSYVDIPVLYAVLPEPFGMLAKQELYRFPVFSAAMRAMRCVPIDRNSRRHSFESLREAAARIQGGTSIVVFPEGTRSPDGSIQELKKGPFYLAEMASVPIVPVGIRGTYDSLAKGSLAVQSADVDVTIGTPIFDSEKGQGARERLRDAVYRALIELTGLPAAAFQGVVGADLPAPRG